MQSLDQFVVATHLYMKLICCVSGFYDQRLVESLYSTVRETLRNSSTTHAASLHNDG